MNETPSMKPGFAVPPQIGEGDLVTHWSEPERVGKVMEVEPDEFAGDADPIFHVAWPQFTDSRSHLIFLIPYRRSQGLRLFEIPQEDPKARDAGREGGVR